ncbi:MAG TPA: 50S ribosomal protein L18 [Gammaproteobacteria bacterium]|nr:50S ribosomal protein L18 [Gammaproteobacteria bacterium]
MNKKLQRLRRAQRGRATIRKLEAVRLCVNRTPRHIYAQIIAPNGASVIVSASTLDKEIKSTLSFGGNVKAAKEVGMLIAKRALEAGVKKIAFDRAGFRYHGRVKALADGAREGGLDF